MRKVPLAGALKHEIYRYFVDLHWMGHEAKRCPLSSRSRVRTCSKIVEPILEPNCRAYITMIRVVYHKFYQFSLHILELEIWNKSIFTLQRNFFFYLVKNFKGTFDGCLSRFSSRKWESIVWLHFISPTFVVKKSRRNSPSLSNVL